LHARYAKNEVFSCISKKQFRAFLILSSLKINKKNFFSACINPQDRVQSSFLRGVLMEENFNKHLGNKLKLRRLALGLTQTKVAKAINVTFQQIQKYEKGTNGVSSIRLLQLSNYLKVPISYFFEDFSEYLINADKIKEGHMNVNYNFLVKLYSELTSDQKIKFSKNLQSLNVGIQKTG
tara:strand:+ start:331 stop:867 length:537 start_codon:yes stop_codon:yes gene_type:complete